MKIQFLHPVVFVKDIALSKRFYTELLGLEIIEEYEVFILFEMHFSIHQAKALTKTVFGEEFPDAMELQGKDNVLLYFEVDELDSYFAKIKDKVDLIHPIITQQWGQRVFRFRDPDGHIVELGESSKNYSEWAAYTGKFYNP